MSKFKEIMAEIDQKHDEVKAIFDKVDADQGGEITDEQKSDVKKLNKEREQLELRATNLREGEEMRAAAETARKARIAASRLPVAEGKDGLPADPSDRYREARKSLGETVLGNNEFKTWREGIAHSSVLTSSAKTNIASPKVQIKTLITGLSDSSGGAMVELDYKPFVNRAPFQPLTIMDLITVGETDSDTVHYAFLSGWTNNAAPVAEATATSGASGTKPESAMAFGADDAIVRTIAHWILPTTRALQDAAQLRTMIDSFLLYGLREEMEQQIINGDGTGENFRGITNTVGTLAQAFVTDRLTTARKARTKLTKEGRVAPSAWLMSPEDWEAFDLELDGEDRYYFGGPSVLGTPRLWGVPVVESENLATGKAVLADWRYAILYRRMQAAISVSNSHADFFIRNMVAILAEERAAFAVTYPKAFEIVTLTAP